MENQSKYREIRDLISFADIGKAIKKIIEIADSCNNSKSSDTARIFQSRLKVLNEKISRGMISSEEESTERNKIASSILDETRKLKEFEETIKIGELTNQNPQLTKDDFFRIAKAANIVIELEKIKERFYNSEWSERTEVLSSLFKYSNHNTIRVSKEVLSFLSSIATSTRSGMNSDVASSIESLIIHYFPYFEKGKEEKYYENFAFQCVKIGDSIFYDSAIYLNDFKVGSKGLQILKWIYWRGKERNNQNVMDRVHKTYKELETTLNRPERDDLGLANEVLQVFKNDLDNMGIFPNEIPNRILEVV